MSGLLKWAIIMAIFAVIAGLLGFGGLSAGFADVAKFLLFLFLAAVGLLVILGLFVVDTIAGPPA
jgi:uncharacterized membrane protein YtjA (UPF0391 family)